MPEGERFLGEILVAGGCITEKELDQALQTQKAESLEEGGHPGTPHRAPSSSRDQAVAPPVVAAALDKQKKFQERQAQEMKVVKVQAEKLDRLVDLVGELVIAGASVNAMASQAHDGRILEATTIVSKLVEEIRDTALGLRMVQIGDTFNRFRRIVPGTSPKEMGKSIDLEIRGGETELDKTIVEKLNDPLMHIVRNSIDHGIEPLEIRRARGKPDTGSLSLNAFHESGSIVIEVADDGGGLNKAKILKKAIERGLVREGADLSDTEITSLIFEPGFSHCGCGHPALGPGRGHGRRAAEHRRTARQHRGGVLRGGRHHAAHPAAVDARDHRRVPGRHRAGLLRRAPRHGDRSAWTWAPSWNPRATTC